MRCRRRDARRADAGSVPVVSSRRERTPQGGVWQTFDAASHAGMIPLWRAPSILA
jgi:hypothetical protein